MNGQERLVRQSKTWLLKALFDLLAEQPYEDISVREIAEKAQLSRRTFYRLYKNKEDLLNSYNSEIGSQYLSELVKFGSGGATLEEGLTFFFEFWWREREQIRLLMRQGLYGRFLEAMNPHVIKVYQRFPAPWHMKGTEKEKTYFMMFAVGGLWNVLGNWLIESEPQSPENMASLMISGVMSLQDEV
ncbi:TetR/AcrR family transcriptional regulator [Levilactobacillus humaensis]|uniref:TetR/AcrR family transcriptional regulator n=1 Tax=Levilactobacillus humaensis TaxID=2950375 RepID=UPI0021C2DC5C|nr:TetR/AcrR family transcriptional regulator [Levilactobacillus humaensis]